MLVGLEDIRVRGGVDEGGPGGVQDDAGARGLRGLENGCNIAGARITRERPAERADVTGGEHRGEELGAAGPHVAGRGLPGLVAALYDSRSVSREELAELRVFLDEAMGKEGDV